jgi:hypothetical protein
MVHIALEGGRVAARVVARRVEELADQRMADERRRGRTVYANRCTNFRAVSATSRQPLSMVSE